MGFGLSINYIMNTLTVATYLAPLFCFSVLKNWGPIFDCFVPESIGIEIVYSMVCTAFLSWIIGPATQFDAITLSVLGIGFNFVWMFLNIVHNPKKVQYSGLKFACLPGMFVFFMGVFFWTLQTGYRAGTALWRRGLGIAAVVFLILKPTTSVVNRLYSRIPDDPWAPYTIKMTLSVLNIVTSAYSVWNQHEQGYHKHKDLQFLFIISWVGTCIAFAEIVVRFIGPLRLSDLVKHVAYQIAHNICPWVFQKLYELCSGLCAVLRKLWDFVIEP